jgi:hypothetical protein
MHSPISLSKSRVCVTFQFMSVLCSESASNSSEKVPNPLALHITTSSPELPPTVTLEFLKSRPIPVVLHLCRRHPESLHVFLAYFDFLLTQKTDLKLYIPFLIHEARSIPIQWIHHHLLHITDVRFAGQVLNSVAGCALTIELNPLQIIEKHTEIWQKFRGLVPGVRDISWFAAWRQMTDLRTDLKDLSDLKMNLRLTDYHESPKRDFVRRIIEGCPTQGRLETLINAHLAHYCHANEVHLPKVLAAAVALHENWTVPQKLQVFERFIHDRADLKFALENLTYKSDADLDEIRLFALTRGVTFVLNPNKYRLTMPPAPGKRRGLQRAPSIEFIGVIEDRADGEVWRHRPPTFPVSPSADLGPCCSLSRIANGHPSDPREYAEKLQKYEGLREMRAIIRLATAFSTVVSFDTYSHLKGRTKTAVRIWAKRSIDGFTKWSSCSLFRPTRSFALCGTGSSS